MGEGNIFSLSVSLHPGGVPFSADGGLPLPGPDRGIPPFFLTGVVLQGTPSGWVTPSQLDWMGVPLLGLDGGMPPPSDLDGVPPSRLDGVTPPFETRWGTLCSDRKGYPFLLGLDGGTPSPSRLDGSTPPPAQEIGKHSNYAAGTMSLVFMQEDFMVFEIGMDGGISTCLLSLRDYYIYFVLTCLYPAQEFHKLVWKYLIYCKIVFALCGNTTSSARKLFLCTHTLLLYSVFCCSRKFCRFGGHLKFKIYGIHLVRQMKYYRSKQESPSA